MTMRNLSGRTALVTGATSGIGYPTALGLARMKAHVFIHGRTAESAARAARQLVADMPEAKVSAVFGDLADLDQVRNLATQVQSQTSTLDILINNAGGIQPARIETAQGFETQFAVNQLAPFLLTQRLYDLLLASSGAARVVNVASRAHYRGKTDIDDLNWKKRPYSGWQAYSDSKLACVATTIAWARRVEAKDICFNAVHPGVIGSSFGKGWPLLSFAVTLARPFLLSNEEGAKTSLHVATSPEVEGVSGGYFSHSLPQEPLKRALDPAFQNDIWERSAAMCGIG